MKWNVSYNKYKYTLYAEKKQTENTLKIKVHESLERDASPRLACFYMLSS